MHQPRLACVFPLAGQAFPPGRHSRESGLAQAGCRSGRRRRPEGRSHGGGRHPSCFGRERRKWIPAFAGMTAWGVRTLPQAGQPRDRKSVVEGKRVSVRVDLGGRRSIKKKKKETNRKVNNQVTKEKSNKLIC